MSKIVEITFKSMVKDYIYLSSGNVVFSADDLLDRWVVDVKAYIPEDRALSIKRKLFRARVLHDLTRYVDIDEAVRLVVDYVTDEPVGNLSASINLTRGSMSTMLSAYVNLIYEKPGSSGLSSSINVQSKQLVVGVGQGKGIDII